MGILNAILAIPGLLSKLWQALFVGAAYGKGQYDGRKDVKLQNAEATNEALQAQKATADSIMRMDEAERRKRLWVRGDDGGQE